MRPNYKMFSCAQLLSLRSGISSSCASLHIISSLTSPFYISIFSLITHYFPSLLLSALSLYFLALCCCLLLFNICIMERRSKKGSKGGILCTPIPIALPQSSLHCQPCLCFGCILLDLGSCFTVAMYNTGRLRFCLWPLGATVIQIIIQSLRSRHVLIHAVYGTGLLQLN